MLADPKDGSFSAILSKNLSADEIVVHQQNTRKTKEKQAGSPSIIHIKFNRLILTYRAAFATRLLNSIEEPGEIWRAAACDQTSS